MKYPDDVSSCVYALHTDQHAKAALWALQSGKHSSVTSRDRHSHLLVEKVAFSQSHAHMNGSGQPAGPGMDHKERSEDIGTLMVTGYVRSRPLSVNSLLHFTGLGSFQMVQVSHSVWREDRLALAG